MNKKDKIREEIEKNKDVINIILHLRHYEIIQYEYFYYYQNIVN